MLAIDTNVVVRYLAGDHPEALRKARALIDSEDISTLDQHIPQVYAGSFGDIEQARFFAEAQRARASVWRGLAAQ
jgi:predicted nucleic acid-binding protein